MFFKKKKTILSLNAQIEEKNQQISDMHKEIVNRGLQIDGLKESINSLKSEKMLCENRLTSLENSPMFKQMNCSGSAVKMYSETITPQVYMAKCIDYPEEGISVPLIKKELAMRIADNLIQDHIIRFCVDNNQCTATLSVVPWEKTVTLTHGEPPSICSISPYKEVEK